MTQIKNFLNIWIQINILIHSPFKRRPSCCSQELASKDVFNVTGACALVKKTTWPSRPEWLVALTFGGRFFVTTLIQPPIVFGSTLVSHTYRVHKLQMCESLLVFRQWQKIYIHKRNRHLLRKLDRYLLIVFKI